VQASGIGLAALAVPGVAYASARDRIGYFSQFGVTESLLRRALATALEKGGDRADLFFQHRVANFLMLEDGAVNRAYTDVVLGVRVRTVRGDQTGYAFTEDLPPASILQTAKTAAAIADGPARPAPASFRVEPRRATHYPVRLAWDHVESKQK